MVDRNLCKIYSAKKFMFLGWGMFILLISIFSCDSDKVDAYQHPGLLQFGLSADTTGIQGAQEVTKTVLSDLEPFLNTDLYRVEILQGEEETVVSSFDHYKDMPDLVELERGSYKIRASMGELNPAAFEAPRFEGISDFIIKENMTTKLDVTCSLANARVTVAYTDSFKVVYPTYSLSIETSHTTEPFEFIQDETRSGWFQVNATGEDLKGILTVKPDTGEVKQYSVNIPSVKPKDNVRLTFNSTPNTRPDQGITVKITINEETEEKPVYIYIPDYMLPVDAALLEAYGFAHEDPIVLGATDQVKEANVKMYVPGTIENCDLLIWEGAGKPEKFDLAHLDEGEKAVLSSKGFTLPDIWRKKQVELDFLPVIAQLPRIEKGSTDVKMYNYQLIVTDSLVNPHVSKPLTLIVKMIPDVAPKILLSDGFISSDPIRVTEGGTVHSEGNKYDPKYEATIQSSRELSACLLKVTDAQGFSNEYDLLGNVPVEGVKYDLTASVPYVNLKEAISALELDDDNIKRYEYELTVKTEFEGTVYEDVKTFIVDLIPPKFEMSMNGDLDVNGDAFAKRAVLRAKAKTGSADKLSFQLFENGEWKDIPKSRMDGEMSVNEDVASVVVTGLQPEMKYQVRAKYGKHVSSEMTFTTEKEEMNIPNSGFEDWYSEDGKIWQGLGKKGPYWYFWYPWNKSDINSQGWNTVNLKTTNADWKYQYNSISGTMRTSDKRSGSYAALIRTVGWGDSNAAVGSANAANIDPGYLYLGTFDSSSKKPNYGYEFTSRPRGFGFYYKYETKDDRFLAEIVVQNRLNGKVIELGRGSFRSGSNINNYTYQEVFVNYDDNSMNQKATHIYIVFKSGDKTSNDTLIEVPKFGNLSDGKYVGSQLYVDDVELIY